VIATAPSGSREAAEQRPTDDTERQRLPAIGQGSSSSLHSEIDARRVSTALPFGADRVHLSSGSLKLTSGE